MNHIHLGTVLHETVCSSLHFNSWTSSHMVWVSSWQFVRGTWLHTSVGTSWQFSIGIWLHVVTFKGVQTSLGIWSHFSLWPGLKWIGIHFWKIHDDFFSCKIIVPANSPWNFFAFLKNVARRIKHVDFVKIWRILNLFFTFFYKLCRTFIFINIGTLLVIYNAAILFRGWGTFIDISCGTLSILNCVTFSGVVCSTYLFGFGSEKNLN